MDFKKTFGWLVPSSDSRVLVPPPVGFTWTPSFSIYRSGSVFDVGTFDVADYAPTGKAYYVDVTTGNDTTGNGTSGNPYKSIAKVLTLPDYDVIYLKPGTYKRGQGGTGGTAFTRSVSIRRWPGYAGDIIVTSAQAGLTWSLTGGMTFVYEATRSAVNDVIDITQVDGNGDYSRLTLVGSIAAVDAAAGSWYTDGTKVYVRLIDDRAPDANVWPLVTNNLRFTGNLTIYLEDIIAVGGVAASGVVWLDNNGAGQTPALYCKNCTISHGSGNGVYVQGASTVILQDCQTFANLADGFNYHALNSVVPSAAEIDCISRDNGTDDALDNDNGSSMHDAGSIIRVNGQYYRNIGPNVIDIDAAKSWNLGCEAHHSLGDGVASANFQVTGTMWLDRCNSHDSAYDLVAAAVSDTIYTRQITSGGNNIATGTIAAY